MTKSSGRAFEDDQEAPPGPPAAAPPAPADQEGQEALSTRM